MNCPLLRTRLVLLLISLGVACQSQGPPLPDLEPTPVQVNPIPEKTLVRLLASAYRAFEEDRLVFPEDGSAYSTYKNILAYDPAQKEALRGIENIVERYLQFANQAVAQGRLASARSMLARARLVDESHQGIPATENRIDWLTHSKRQVVKLEAAELQSRATNLSQRLRQLGTRAKSLSAQVIITARSDTDGRWIYQQMKKGKGDGRVHAQLQIGTPASVAILVTKPTS